MSRQFYIEHGWQMPDGYKRDNDPDLLNFSLEEWQQAKRTKHNPKEVKAIFQKCWAQSDDLKSFAIALKRQGYFLAQGDRRGFVAVDQYLEIHSIARRIGIKNKEVNAKLGDSSDLLSVEETQELIRSQTENSEDTIKVESRRQQTHQAEYERARKAMIMRHRRERADLLKRQEERRIEENKIRAARLPTGLKALWFRLTGKYRKIKEQNAMDKRVEKLQERTELDALNRKQIVLCKELSFRFKQHIFEQILKR